MQFYLFHSCKLIVFARNKKKRNTFEVLRFVIYLLLYIIRYNY